MSLPIQKNISIYEGDSFFIKIRLRQRDQSGAPGPYVDLTDSFVKAQIRPDVNSSTVSADFSTEHNGIGGEITLSLSPTQTAALPPAGRWDMQVTFPDNTVKTYVRGSVEVQQEVTRAE